MVVDALSDDCCDEEILRGNREGIYIYPEPSPFSMDRGTNSRLSNRSRIYIQLSTENPPEESIGCQVWLSGSNYAAYWVRCTHTAVQVITPHVIQTDRPIVHDGTHLASDSAEFIATDCISKPVCCR
jgi:hypothetical protein